MRGLIYFFFSIILILFRVSCITFRVLLSTHQRISTPTHYLIITLVELLPTFTT
jgi:hypothetical protein